MKLGFSGGVIWGALVSVAGLAVLSQVGLPPTVTPGVAPTALVEGQANAEPGIAKPPAVKTPVPVAVPPVEPAPVPTAVPSPAQKTTRDHATATSSDTEAVPGTDFVAPISPTVTKGAPEPVESALPPDAVTDAPASNPVVSPDAAAPQPPAVVIAPVDPAPPQAAAQPQVAAQDAGPDADPPPPAPQEVLLQPAPAPVIDPSPASIAPDPSPVADLPLPVPPLPGTQPDAPPAGTVTADAAPAGTAPPPEIDAASAPRIIADDRPSTLTPDPGLAPAGGVKVGQLPRIASDAPPLPETAPDASADTAVPEVAIDDRPLKRYARAFDNPDQKPLFGILLRDDGAADIDRAALAQLSFPVTFVIDPLAPGAVELAAIYRAAGQEVLMQASGIPDGATAADLEQTFQTLEATLPESVAVIDLESAGFQGNRPLATQVIAILAAQGRGLVTFDTGLNAADQEARRAGVPSAVVFRRLDAENEPTDTIRRYLDRAAFKAAQEGRVLVLGETRPATIAALLEWAVEGRAASVALAPVSAVLSTP